MPATFPTTTCSADPKLHARRCRSQPLLVSFHTLCAIAAFVLLTAAATLDASAFSNKQGPFEWHPKRSPNGPVVIIVSLPAQTLSVYRNGVRIGRSPVSTGKPGHRTPTGVFTILQKDADHHSSIYNNASMPFTERLTWSGVALHAGGLPGYPESHGCIHLSLKFSKLLFGITHIGTAVIVAGAKTAPASELHPGPFLPAVAKAEADAALQKIKKKKLHHPKAHGWSATVSKSKTTAGKPKAGPHISIVASAKNNTVEVFNGDQLLFRSSLNIKDPGAPLGTHLYTLVGIAPNGTHLQWSGVAVSGSSAGRDAGRAIGRVLLPPDATKKILHLLHPGATFLITDGAAGHRTRSDNGFMIMRHASRAAKR